MIESPRSQPTLRRLVLSTTMALALLSAPRAPLHAQRLNHPFVVHATRFSASSPGGGKTLFSKRDLEHAGIALAATAAISVFDVRFAHWWQQSNVQGDTSRAELVHSLTKWNEAPLTLGAIATYGIGRLIGSKTTADIGAHLSEALILTVAASEIIRAPLGRARPRVSPDDQYKFELGGGFTKFEDRAFPSLHSAVGFATASVLVGEIKERRSGAVWIAAPILYAAALVPGVTRIYLNQHWASDVFAGAFLGELIGSRIVSYGHRHQNKIDRLLLGSTVTSERDGRVLVFVSLSR